MRSTCCVALAHGDPAVGARPYPHLQVVFYYHFAFLAISIAPLRSPDPGGVSSYVVAGSKAACSPAWAVSASSIACSSSWRSPSSSLRATTSPTRTWPSSTSPRPARSSPPEPSSRSPSADHPARQPGATSSTYVGAAAGCLLRSSRCSNSSADPEHRDRRRRHLRRRRGHLAQHGRLRQGRVGSVALALALVAFLSYNPTHPVITPPRKDQTLANEIYVNGTSRASRSSTDRRRTTSSSMPTPFGAQPATSISPPPSEPSSRRGPRRRRCPTPAPRRQNPRHQPHRDSGRRAALYDGHDVTVVDGVISDPHRALFGASSWPPTSAPTSTSRQRPLFVHRSTKQSSSSRHPLVDA